MNARTATREARRQYRRFDEKAADWLRQYEANGGRVCCGPGCSACCSYPVRISLVEAVALGEALTPAQHEDVQRHARKVLRNARASRTDDEYVRNHQLQVGPCPLLDRTTGRCTAYEARPARCRDTYAALSAKFCSLITMETLPAQERRAYQKAVRSGPEFDGHSHYLAPLEDLSLPAWEAFSRLMRREIGFEIWGDLAYLVHLTRNEPFMASLTARDRKATIGALKREGLYHPQIVQVE